MNTPTEAPAPHFGSEDDKARKAYGLTSGLLLAWELIGIELPETPLENVKVTLKSPQAVPYVLIALVLYFAFRITIEWYQSEPARRRLWASRVDFAVAHGIGVAALLLFAIQAFLHVQVANKIKGLQIMNFVVGCGFGIFTASLILALADHGWSLRQTWREDKRVILYWPLFLGYFAIPPAPWEGPKIWILLDKRWIFVGCCSGRSDLVEVFWSPPSTQLKVPPPSMRPSAHLRTPNVRACFWSQRVISSP